MLVPVEYQTVSKWVKVPKTEDVYSYSGFIQEVRAKFNLPDSTTLILKDSAGVEVDPDIFDELLKSVQVSLKAFTKESNDDQIEDLSSDASLSEASFSEASFSEWSPSRASIASSGSGSGSGSGSTIILESTKARKRQLLEGPPDSSVARDIVQAALHSKPGGVKIFKEYDQKKSLSDGTRKIMVNILVADMVETHGRIPPVKARILYALGIITLFPNLKDPDSKNGYEHFYDHQSGLGYLAYRLKTVQRNSPDDAKKSKSSFQEGPKTPRPISTTVRQLSGDECKEAMSMMRHSADKKIVKEKMMATFQHRQKVVQDPATASNVLDMFPRFLDTPGLIDQDFTLLFGEELSRKFLARWPTFFKPRIISDCKNLAQSAHLTDLLLSAQKIDGGVWDSEVAGLLLLLHLLPPTSKGRKTSKQSSSDAVNRLVKFLKVGQSMETFIRDTDSVQPFLLCIGEKKNSLQNFYIILDQKVIPCSVQTGVAAFDELFKAHFAFALSYDEALLNFYTFIQTTVYGIDIGSMKESPRVKEIRARLLNTEL